MNTVCNNLPPHHFSSTSLVRTQQRRIIHAETMTTNSGTRSLSNLHFASVLTVTPSVLPKSKTKERPSAQTYCTNATVTCTRRPSKRSSYLVYVLQIENARCYSYLACHFVRKVFDGSAPAKNRAGVCVSVCVCLTHRFISCLT